MRSHSYDSSPISYENISNRINRLKSGAGSTSTLGKSETNPNINYKYSRLRASDNIDYNSFRNNVGKVTKNTGIKKYTHRHVKEVIKGQLGEENNK